VLQRSYSKKKGIIEKYNTDFKVRVPYIFAFRCSTRELEVKLTSHTINCRVLEAVVKIQSWIKKLLQRKKFLRTLTKREQAKYIIVRNWKMFKRDGHRPTSISKKRKS